MPTVIDELVVTLGLDPTKFTEGQKKAADAFIKTRENATKTGKGIETSANKAAEAFTRIRNQVLALGAALIGATGVEQFVARITKMDASTGRLAGNLGILPSSLGAWEAASESMGGSAEGTAASLTKLSNSIQELKLTGTSDIIPMVNALNGLQGAIRIDPSTQTVDEVLKNILTDLRLLQTQQGNATAYAMGKKLGLDEGLINMALRTTESVDAMVQKFKDLQHLTKDNVEAAGELSKAWTTATEALTGAGRQLVDGLAPGLIMLLDLITKTAKGLGDILPGNLKTWMDENLGPEPGAPGSDVAPPTVSTQGSATGPRGIRNNNPLNLKFVPGQVGAFGADTAGFGRYVNMESGVAAAQRQLVSYQDKQGLTTVRQMVTRWAPPGENDTAGYVAEVARRTGINPDVPVDMHDPAVSAKVVAAMAHRETGQDVDPGAISRGVAMGLGTAPDQTLAAARPDQTLAAARATTTAPQTSSATSIDHSVEVNHSGDIHIDVPSGNPDDIAGGIKAAMQRSYGAAAPQFNTGLR